MEEGRKKGRESKEDRGGDVPTLAGRRFVNQGVPASTRDPRIAATAVTFLHTVSFEESGGAITPASVQEVIALNRPSLLGSACGGRRRHHRVPL
ncbi:hypothetical protein VPH35_089691 [Triticum aestivum]